MVVVHAYVFLYAGFDLKIKFALNLNLFCLSFI